MDYSVWAEETLIKIRAKMKWAAKKNRDKLPYTTDAQGNYDDMSSPEERAPFCYDLCWWTNGFWGGMMWLLWQDTHEEQYRLAAESCEKKLQKCFELYYGLHHDVGFQYVPTAVMHYRLTGDPVSRRTALHAASLLAGRFNPAGSFIRAWNTETEDTRGWVIIDCMMNLSLLYWASRETRDPRFKHIAMAHADTVMRNFIRPDGSSCHIVEFDPETGERVCCHRGQGYAVDSSWARGQGWALYGFTLSYGHTGKQAYLETAIRSAEYCISRIPPDGVVPVDFCQPEVPAYEDSCGGCIIASGLLELSQYVKQEDRERYRAAAYQILSTIAAKKADWGEDCDAIVQNCSAAYHGKVHHIPMSYADYFFLEAVYKLAGMDRKMW